MWLLLAGMGLLNRRVVLSCVSAAAVGPFAQPYASWASVDCMKDCESNCNRVAPKSGRYCFDSCVDYCQQSDRRDGLSGALQPLIVARAGRRSAPRRLQLDCLPSPTFVLAGSVSNEAAEVGWASAYDPGRFLPGRRAKGVVYGDDRPPALPLPELGAALRKAVTGGARPGGGPSSVEALGGVPGGK
jgi:hypothetical protein